MADKQVNARLKMRTDSSSNWASNNPVLLNGEIGVDSTLHQFKIGDGVRTFSALPWSGTYENATTSTAGLMSSTDKTKLDGLENTGVVVSTGYPNYLELNSVGGGGGADANAVHYTVDTGKTAEQKAQARANIGAQASESGKGLYPDADATKLAGIEAGADVTDAANVAAAGAQMVSNLVTSVSAQSTDAQYPSAKLLYDTVGTVEAALNAIRGVSV